MSCGDNLGIDISRLGLISPNCVDTQTRDIWFAWDTDKGNDSRHQDGSQLAPGPTMPLLGQQ